MQTNTELHAGEGETSQMLVIAPETVHMERAVDYVPSIPRPYLSYGSILCACPDGVWGEATKSSRETGEKILERATELSVQSLNDAFAYMAQKKPLNYSNF